MPRREQYMWPQANISVDIPPVFRRGHLDVFLEEFQGEARGVFLCEGAMRVYQASGPRGEVLHGEDSA